MPQNEKPYWQLEVEAAAENLERQGKLTILRGPNGEHQVYRLTEQGKTEAEFNILKRFNGTAQ